MINEDLGLVFFLAIILLGLIVASMYIPFYGFIRKRWKGLAIGCLIQPFAYAIICILVIGGMAYYEEYDIKKQRKAAMVTLKKAEENGYDHFWYLKPNEECFYEYKTKDDDDDGERHRYKSADITKLFDILPQDSFSVCVDDVIVVKFDLYKREVTAAEYDEPLEVINVDWDKVNEYFKKRNK